MTWIEGSVERSGKVPAPRDEVWAVVSDVTRFGQLMPSVRRYERVDDGWLWELEGRSPMGPIRPTFTVRYELDPPREVRFDSLERQRDRPATEGAVRLAERDGGTEATMRLKVGVDAPVSSFLSGPARRFITGELARLCDGFISNLRAAVTH